MLGKAMRGGVNHAAGTVGGGAGSTVVAAQNCSLHLLPRNRGDR